MSKYDEILNTVSADCVVKVLKGDVKSLIKAFPWCVSPEGFYYWNKIYDSGRLPSQARFKLQAMLRAKEKHPAT